MSDIAIIRKYQFAYEAELARTALEAEGIETAILADNAGGMLPVLQILFPVRLAVKSDDEARALEILEALEAPDEDESEPLP